MVVVGRMGGRMFEVEVKVEVDNYTSLYGGWGRGEEQIKEAKRGEAKGREAR